MPCGLSNEGVDNLGRSEAFVALDHIESWTGRLLNHWRPRTRSGCVFQCTSDREMSYSVSCDRISRKFISPIRMASAPANYWCYTANAGRRAIPSLSALD